ncbi:uncharacterized protein AMSG_04528 [Thecamonas trahens ATCC 50062]|uniref:DH domain-containing protein n=1 Tax=Thecamonas trahens ATCC 50062 TaxID=461836 RepID=A0A0L0D7D2_THETB|nr:hypothetical protein AMSG_04528 [Thecamonas trahens ATCC 50062]KNC48297.1 hypothetical protein AMSG_04528 [Thecamonas trahens ATCC 50062]|eukprot:XP_013758864.1 hypothetical protein AMSG_04528 [Thecamonas trahens ATCC 50062]
MTTEASRCLNRSLASLLARQPGRKASSAGESGHSELSATRTIGDLRSKVLSRTARTPSMSAPRRRPKSRVLSRRLSMARLHSGDHHNLLLEAKARKIQMAVRKWLFRRRHKGAVVRLRKRNSAAKEILSTEEVYVARLSVVVNVFLEPLRYNATQAANPFVTTEEIGAIFSSVELILALNSELLLTLRERMSGWNPGDTLLADIFLHFAPLFILYAEYSSKFEEGMKTLNRLAADPGRGRFLAFLQHSASHPDVPHGLSLADLLIAPVQRLPRYVLLLRELIRYTQPLHPDYHALQDAIEKVTACTSSVNSAISRHAALASLLDFDATMLPSPALPQLVQPWRRLLGKYDVTTDDGSPLLLVLFNDMLLWAEPKPDSMYKYVASVGLESCVLVHHMSQVDAAERDEGPELDQLSAALPIIPLDGFHLAWGTELSTFHAKSAATAEVMISDILAAMDERLAANPDLVVRRARAVAPLVSRLPGLAAFVRRSWVDDVSDAGDASEDSDDDNEDRETSAATAFLLGERASGGEPSTRPRAPSGTARRGSLVPVTLGWLRDLSIPSYFEAKIHYHRGGKLAVYKERLGVVVPHLLLLFKNAKNSCSPFAVYPLTDGEQVLGVNKKKKKKSFTLSIPGLPRLHFYVKTEPELVSWTVALDAAIPADAASARQFAAAWPLYSRLLHPELTKSAMVKHSDYAELVWDTVAAATGRAFSWPLSRTIQHLLRAKDPADGEYEDAAFVPATDNEGSSQSRIKLSHILRPALAKMQNDASPAQLRELGFTVAHVLLWGRVTAGNASVVGSAPLILAVKRVTIALFESSVRSLRSLAMLLTVELLVAPEVLMHHYAELDVTAAGAGPPPPEADRNAFLRCMALLLELRLQGRKRLELGDDAKLVHAAFNALVALASDVFARTALLEHSLIDHLVALLRGMASSSRVSKSETPVHTAAAKVLRLLAQHDSTRRAVIEAKGLDVIVALLSKYKTEVERAEREASSTQSRLKVSEPLTNVMTSVLAVIQFLCVNDELREQLASLVIVPHCWIFLPTRACRTRSAPLSASLCSTLHHHTPAASWRRTWARCRWRHR